MTRNARRLIVLVLLAAFLPGSMSAHRAVAGRLPQESACPPITTAPSSADFAPLVRTQNDFGFRLLHTIEGKTPTSNAFISPTSVSMALAMAYDGAHGATARSMATALGLGGLSQRAVRQEAAALLNRLRTSGTGTGLAVANSLWARQGTTFRAPFLRHAQSDYGAPARVLDFNAPSAPATINSWVSCATQGKIPRIISTIRPDEVLFLINAVFFHGDWAHAFLPAGKRTFTTARGTQVKVPFMSRVQPYPYVRGPNFQAVRLPYVDPRFSMVIVLPGARTSVGAFARQVTASSWSHWTARLRTEWGGVAMPHFSIQNVYQLKNALSGMGMAKAFSRRADFSGMCMVPCALSEVRHKTYLAVNERGTVAAAATSVGISESATSPNKFDMIIDHPFFVSIQDSVTGAVLFTGLVANPAE
jgi:serpin B